MKKKLMAMLLTGCMAMTMFPMSALAAEDPEAAPQTTTFALTGSKIETITGNATSTGDETVDVTVTPGNELQWVAKDASVGRNADGWWVGIKAFAPMSITKDNVTNAKYRNSTTFTEKSFGDNRDSKDTDPQQFIQLWGGIKEENLNAEPSKTSYTYTWYFNWDGNDNTGNTVPATEFADLQGVTDMKGVDQTITMTFDLNNTKLMKDNQVVWPKKPIQLSFEALEENFNFGGSFGNKPVTDLTENLTIAMPDVEKQY